MVKKAHPQTKRKLVFRSSPTALKVVLIVLILFSMVALLALRWVHTGILAETENLRDEAAAIDHANSELERKTDELGSLGSIEEIAKDELGLVDPDTIIIDPIS